MSVGDFLVRRHLPPQREHREGPSDLAAALIRGPHERR
jgi:hypothetical protein